MKKTFFAFLILAGITASFAGCTNTTDEASVSSTEKITNETTVTTEEPAFIDIDNSVYYATFEEFETKWVAENPDVYLYTPPQDFELISVISDTTYYEYQLRNADQGAHITVQIMFPHQYDDVQERIDELNEGVSNIRSEIVQQEQDYYINYYPDTDHFVLYGLTGEHSTYYALDLWYDDHDSSADDLLTLRETLDL